MGTFWVDTSQYQDIPIDDSYPFQVYCLRTNSGDREDTLAVENARRALDMLDRGRLDLVIGYWFFWPGQANCDLHRDVLRRGGLWGHPRLVSMADVEGAPAGDPPVKRIRGDQSVEVNDEITRVAGWYGDRRRVVGYWNPVADPELWLTRPGWLRLVVPSYGRTPGQPRLEPPGFFAHQFTETGRAAPWGDRNVDLNYSPLELPDLLASFGIQGGTMSDPVVEGARQLHPFPDKIRPIVHPEHVNSSTGSPAGRGPTTCRPTSGTTRSGTATSCPARAPTIRRPSGIRSSGGCSPRSPRAAPATLRTRASRPSSTSCSTGSEATP